MQQRIDAFVAAGLQPHTTSTGAVIARRGTRFQTLVDSVGQRTQAGIYYEQASSSNLPAGGFDYSQAPTRSGDTEYIRMRSGEQRSTRRWDPASQDYRFTDIGRSYYARLKRDYVVQVPVRITGERRDGSQYHIRSTLPVARLGIDRVELPLNLTAAQRTAKIKQIVSNQLDLSRPLLEVSAEFWTFDASDGAWIIHEETVIRDPTSGEMVVALDRRVGTAPLSASELPFAEHLCAEAFESHDDHLCVPR